MAVKSRRFTSFLIRQHICANSFSYKFVKTIKKKKTNLLKFGLHDRVSRGRVVCINKNSFRLDRNGA